MHDLRHLEHWYRRHCDGEWECRAGITLASTASAGWRLRIELTGTELAGRILGTVEWDESCEDWLHYGSDGRAFTASCGPANLGLALDAFRRFATSERRDRRSDWTYGPEERADVIDLRAVPRSDKR